MLYLAMSSPTGHGGVSRTANALRSHGDDAHLHLRVLLSFHYYKDTDLDALFTKYFTEPYPEVFIDSGAFSADTQGVPINMDEYIAYIKRYQHLITTYSNLDVIRKPEATWANQQRMEDAGLSPLPVFHGGTDWKWLEHYIERYPYIALGGIVGKVSGAKGWIARCFQMAQGRAVYHGFGVTAWDVLKAFPWYSVDSSSWGQGFRFGSVPVFNKRRGTFVKINLGDKRGWGKHSSLVRSLGFDPMDFADRSRNDRAKIAAISALSYMQAEKWLRKRHGEIHIPDRGADAGRALHLASWPPEKQREQHEGQAIIHNGLKLHLVTADSTSSNMGTAALADAFTEIDGKSIPRPGEIERVRGAPGGVRLHLADSHPPDTDVRHVQHFTTRRTPDDQNHTNRRLRLLPGIYRRDHSRELAA